jgi:hypothetical protein
MIFFSFFAFITSQLFFCRRKLNVLVNSMKLYGTYIQTYSNNYIMSIQSHLFYSLTQLVKLRFTPWKWMHNRNETNECMHAWTPLCFLPSSSSPSLFRSDVNEEWFPIWQGNTCARRGEWRYLDGVAPIGSPFDKALVPTGVHEHTTELMRMFLEKSAHNCSSFPDEDGPTVDREKPSIGSSKADKFKAWNASNENEPRIVPLTVPWMFILTTCSQNLESSEAHKLRVCDNKFRIIEAQPLKVSELHMIVTNMQRQNRSSQQASFRRNHGKINPEPKLKIWSDVSYKT